VKLYPFQPRGPQRCEGSKSHMQRYFGHLRARLAALFQNLSCEMQARRGRGYRAAVLGEYGLIPFAIDGVWPPFDIGRQRCLADLPQQVRNGFCGGPPADRAARESNRPRAPAFRASLDSARCAARRPPPAAKIFQSSPPRCCSGPRAISLGTPACC
jgi:hypothetical protein